MYRSKLYSFFLGSLLLLSWFVVASVYSAIKYAHSNQTIQKKLDLPQRPLIIPNIDEYRIDYIIDTNQYEVAPVQKVMLAVEYKESDLELSSNDEMIYKLREIAQTTRELCLELNDNKGECYGNE